jgi:hypothetical protein
MKTHIQIVAALHIAMGALSLLGAIAVFAFLGMAGGIVVSQGEHEAAGIIGIVAVCLAAFLRCLHYQVSSAVGHCSRVALGAAHSSWYWVLYTLSTFLSEQLSAFTPFGHCSANHHLRLQVLQPFNQSPNFCWSGRADCVSVSFRTLLPARRSASRST